MNVMCAKLSWCYGAVFTRGADKSLARPGRKQATANKRTPHEAQYTSYPFTLTFANHSKKEIRKLSFQPGLRGSNDHSVGRITTFKTGSPSFWRWYTMVHVPLMFLSELCEFPSAPCLAGKKKLMTARISMVLKSRASPDMLPFSLCNKKRLAIRHMNRSLFPTTLSIPSYDNGK